MRRILMVFALLLAVAAGAPRAAAEPEGGEARVLVHVSGPQRVRVLRVFERVLGERGHEVLRARAKPGRLAAEALERGASLILAVEVRKGRPATLRVVVVDLDGETIGTGRLRDRNPVRLARRLRGRLWDEIGALVEQGVRAQAAEEPEEPPPAASGERPVSRGADAEANADVATSATRGDPGPPPLAVSVGGEVMARSFGYRDDLFDELARYDVAARPALGVDAVWYPAAHLGASPGGWAGRVGVAARFLYVTPFETSTADGERYTTRASSFRVGLRWRQPLGGAELGGIADYAGRSFSFDQGDALRPPEVPGVRYRSLRLGAEVRAPLAGAWSGVGSLAYRHVLSSGEIESDAYFPRASARGVDAGLWLARPLKERFELRLGAALERYGYDLAPEPGDMRVAGGAVDQYLSVSLSLGYRN